MNRTHKIALAPTWTQGALFAQHAGYARVAYNHALADLKAGLDVGEWCGERTLRPRFNAVKFERYPWALVLSQNAVKYSIIALGDAVKAWRNDRQANRFPSFKSRRKHRRAFRADNGPDTVSVEGKRVKLPKIGWVKMRERLRFAGSIREVSIVQDGGRWFACVAVRTNDEPMPFDPSKPTLGVDVGIPTLATVSDGSRYANAKPLTRRERKMARMQKAVSRSENVHGRNRRSARRDRKREAVRKLHARIKNLRDDAHHKATTAIAVAGGVIGVESLNVRGLQRNRWLAKHVADASLGGFLLKLGYKSEMYGGKVIVADQWFPSSKMCSSCGRVKDDLTLGERVFRCLAGCEPMDRDVNAAINLREYAAASYAEARNGCGESVRPARRVAAAVLGEASTPTRRTAAATSPVPKLVLSSAAD